MQSWSAMPVIDLTGRSLHYLYSSWLIVTLYVWQTLLNQFSNFVGCLSCKCRTDIQMLSTPEHVKPIWQGCLVLNLCSGCLLDQTRSFGRVEFTQPLGVGLGLVFRINNQYSHPVCMGRCTDAYTTINDTWEISQKTGYLLRNVHTGIREIAGTAYHVDDMQMMQTIKSQLMMSHGSCKKQLHKSITQMNYTK